jgi:glycosyltransferase involved in cell wall biosynthesis
MKLIIQIPCFNEEETLPQVLKGIPDQIEGIDTIETMIINDGSTDNTVEVARKYGVHHIVNNVGNRGLGNTFREGMLHAIKLGADILVNTDGDNQYPSIYISDLVKPILDGHAEIVIGDRQTNKIRHFSPLKRFLQWMGTQVTKALSGDNTIRDAVSGFRAYSRNALLELNITSNFSYILDTTVQASNKKLKTVTKPISVNPPTRPSRLFKSMWEHIWKSGTQILRIYALYKPLRVFFGIGLLFLVAGALPIIRFLYHYFFLDKGSGMIQSLVIGGVLISISINLFSLGIIGDLMSKNRKLIEYILKEIKDK